MRYVLLGLLLVLSTFNVTYAKPLIRLSVVCFGEQPDCPRSDRVAYAAASSLARQLDIDFKIMSTREIALPEIDPVLEVQLAQFKAIDIAERDNSQLVLFISPRADYNMLGVSYIGVVGVRPAATINHLIEDDQLSVDVVAHEMAHAMGAEHDVTGLMTPVVSDPQHSSRLSKLNVAQIKEHLQKVLSGAVNR